MPGQYSQPPVVTSDVRNGFDRSVVYADGQSRVMRNYFLPIPIDDNNRGYLEKTYQFGSALDPMWNAGYSVGTIQLVDDYKSGNDRIAVYSDGSTYRSADWYIRYPQYNPNPPVPSYVPPVFQQDPNIRPPNYVPPSAGISLGVDPSDIVIPINTSAPAPGALAGNTPASIPRVSDTTGLFSSDGDYTPQGPIQASSLNPVSAGPGYATGNTTLPTVTVSVPPLPNFGPLAIILLALAVYLIK